MANDKVQDIIDFVEDYLGYKIPAWQKDVLRAIYAKAKTMKKPMLVWYKGQIHLIDAEEPVV